MRRAYLAASLVLVVSTAAAQHRHPPEDQALHEKFYSTWYMPDNPNSSCCNDVDCYPTEVKARICWKSAVGMGCLIG
jgi:hypothetical protein